MSAIAAAGVVSAGLGIYKAVKGANQAADAKRLAKNNIFTPEELPYETQLSTDLAARNYTNGMPGEGQARNDINRNAASSFYRGSEGASSGGDVLDLATRIGMGTSTATNQLAAQGAQYKANALGEYQGALGNEAQWKDRLYKNNTLNPYIRTANLAASMYGAGQQNLYSGLDDIGSSVVGAATAYAGKTGSQTPQTFGQQNNTIPLASASGGGYVPYNPPLQTGGVSPYEIPQTNLSPQI